MLQSQSRVCRNSKAGEEKDRGTDIPSGFTTHLASALGKKDMSWLGRKAHYSKEEGGDVSKDSTCLTARIVQEFGGSKTASSGALEEEGGYFVPLGEKHLFFHCIAFCQFRIARIEALMQ